MGKDSKKKAATKPNETTKEETTSSDKNDPMNPDIPEDVLEYKQKLERETGKKYKYRAPKKDLPSINHMLAHGAPEEEGRPRTWLELVGYPILMLALFCLSFAIFLWVDPISNSRYKRGRFALPKKNNRPPLMTSGGATGSTPVAKKSPDEL